MFENSNQIPGQTSICKSCSEDAGVLYLGELSTEPISSNYPISLRVLSHQDVREAENCVSEQ